MLELFRGCIRGCRFCQAGFVYRPVRTRSEDLLVKYGIEACQDSGYQDMTLMSLSSSDYPDLLPLCDGLLEWCGPHKVNLALPSLRADNFSMNLMEKLQRGGRKSGLTFAPEAGSQRLRDAINKNVTEEDLLNSCRTAFSGGWSSVKLYFMLGLPTETDEDVLGIADLAQKVYHVWRENRAKLREMLHLAEKEQQKAIDYLKEAKACHDTLEELYHPYVDFKYTDQVTEKVLEEILALPDQPLATSFFL